MNYFAFTFINVILPIFLIITTGAVANTVFKLDIKTLTKLQFYVLIPCMLFVMVYESELSGKIIINAAIATIILLLTINIVSIIIAKLGKFSREDSSVFVNASTYFNCGNYSLPLIHLLFKDPVAVSIQAIVLMAHNLVFFTIGIFTAGAGSKGAKEALLYVAKMPLLYVMAVAALMRTSGVVIPQPIWEPVTLIATSYNAIALLTLGAQLADTKFQLANSKLYLSNFVRLIMSPMVAYAIVSIMGISGMLARILVIGAGAPTAVNVVLTSIEMENDPRFASQVVFTSTILSSITITITILAVSMLIPL